MEGDMRVWLRRRRGSAVYLNVESVEWNTE
jgi:hypothetical protein